MCIPPPIYNHPIPFSGWTLQWIDMVEMPTILDSLFHKVVNTTSSPIGVENWGGREPQSGGTFRFKKIIWPNVINSGCFQLYISQYAATYIDAYSHKPVLWQFPASCLPGRASLSHLQTTRTPVDVDRLVNEASVKVDH